MVLSLVLYCWYNKRLNWIELNTNRVFNLRIFAAVISFAQCVSHHHWKQCFDNDCSCDTFKCTNSACFRAESTRSRTAILSATCPVVCCAMLGCVQFGSVVWRVTRAKVMFQVCLVIYHLQRILICLSVELILNRFIKLWMMNWKKLHGGSKVIPYV